MTDDPDDDAPAWAPLLKKPAAGGAQAEGAAPPASTEVDDEPPPAWAAGLKTPAHGIPHPASTPSAPHPQHAPTLFHQSAAPPSPETPEPSWGEVGTAALHNALPSLGGVGKSIVDSVMHPAQTLGALGELGKGALSQAAGALGVQQDPAQKAQNEALISALEKHYGAVYGSTRGLKKAIATDPASVAMDASTLLGGAGVGAEAAGLAKTAGVLGKMGSAVDPVANAMRVASLPVKAAAPILRQASSLTTGVPASALKLAGEVGGHPDPAVRLAYTRFATGQGDATEFQQAAQGAVNSIKKDMSDAYLAQKGPMAQTPVSLTGTYDAVNAAIKKAQMGSRTGQVPQKAMNAILEARDMVDDVAKDPARSTLENVDALKQQLWDLKSLHPELADSYLNGIYHGVRNDLIGADPEYAALMERYQVARQNIQDLTKTLGAGPNTAASAMLVKNLRALKTGTGENLLSQIMEKDPRIGGMLAGSAVHPWHAGGRSAFEALLAAPAAGAVFTHPAAAAVAVPASLLSSSPRIAGALNYGAGATGRILSEGAMMPKGIYYAGRAGQEEGQDAPGVVGELPPPVAQTWKQILQQESGGRQFKKDGTPLISKAGAVGIAQVMPKTGPAAAKLAGEEWSLDRLKHDAAYNERLGRAYFTSLVQQYGGDLHKAAAAYNAGPGNVDRALNLAEASGRPWLAHLPAETQNYVPAVMGRAGRASGGRTPLTHTQLVDRLMSRARAAKKHGTETTKPLLHLPDTLVAKALEVAQKAI